MQRAQLVIDGEVIEEIGVNSNNDQAIEIFKHKVCSQMQECPCGIDWEECYGCPGTEDE